MASAAAEVEPDTSSAASEKWLPLESAPEVLNPFIKSIGVDPKWQFCDVFGTEPMLLAMVPTPVAAVCLLYPSTPKFKAFKRAQAEKLAGAAGPTDLFFIKQLPEFGNACGTIAALHATINADLVDINKGPLSEFMAKTVKSTPNDRGLALFNNEPIKKLSDGCASSSGPSGASTRCPTAEEKVGAHFICFIHKGGFLFEVDGCKVYPIKHGPTRPETLLQDTAKIIKTRFMALEPTNLNFNMMALVQKQS